MTQRLVTQLLGTLVIGLGYASLCGTALPSEPHPETSQLSWFLDYSAHLVDNVQGGLAVGQTYQDDGYVGAVWVPSPGSPWQPRFAASARYNNGQSISNTVGDLQGVSNVEAHAGARLYEVWAEFSLPGERGHLRLGLQDLNTAVQVLDTASTLFNGSFGMGPEFGLSGVNGPSSFPVPGLAATLHWHLMPRFELTLAAADGVPGSGEDPTRPGFELSSTEGALIVAELGARGSLGRIAGGVWGYTAGFSEFSKSDVHASQGNSGRYLLFESPELLGLASTRARAFARLGEADERFNQVARNVAAGIAVVFERDGTERILALGATHAELGGPYRRAAAIAGQPAVAHESVFEITYLRPVVDWLSVQPGVQYVINPGGYVPLEDALVVALRITMALQSTGR